MKTSIELDAEKVKLAKKLGTAQTLRQLVDEALDAYIQRARRESMANLLGGNWFEGDLQTMRKRNHGRTRR